MPQLQLSVFPGQQRKNVDEDNNDKTNATYETTGTETKKSSKRRTAVERSVLKTPGVPGVGGDWLAKKQFYLRKTSPLILISETSHWNIYNQNTDETEQSKVVNGPVSWYRSPQLRLFRLTRPSLAIYAEKPHITRHCSRANCICK